MPSAASSMPAHLFFHCIILPYDLQKSDALQATPFVYSDFPIPFWFSVLNCQGLGVGMFLLLAIKAENINCHCQGGNFSWV